MKRIYVVGTADTKGEELAFLADAIAATGNSIARVDIGTRGATVPVDIPAGEVAAHHPDGAGAVLGTWLGVERLPRPWLLRMLAVVLLIAGAKLLFA